LKKSDCDVNGGVLHTAIFPINGIIFISVLQNHEHLLNHSHAMSFFKGQETYSIDEKGRVNVPTKMRKSIQPEAGDTFILTRGVDKCIVAYPMNEWKVYEEKFAKLNQYSEKDRFFLRMILSWSEEVEMDAQQRVSVPKRLREFAGIESKVTIVGMIDHIELWQPEEFDKYLNGQAESYEDVAAKVMTKD
jgi:MraZ protein